MPKNKVSDLITDQEIAFALLILSGNMTDRQAAEAVGLNPDTAAYTKSKPRVRAYMVEHRARMQQQLVQQEADLSRLAVEEVRRKNQRREQVLDRLWEIASMSSELTRGSITGQVKALSMIVAIEGLIPDRRAGSAQMKAIPPPTQPQIDADPWRAGQQAEATGPQPNPAEEEDELGVPQDEPALSSAVDAPGSESDPSEPTFAEPLFARDTRVPFSIKKNPFARRR